VRDRLFVEPSTAVLPRHRPSTLAIAAAFHILLFTVLMVVKTQAVRVSSSGSPSAGIAAYVAAATGASKPKPAAPKKAAPTTQSEQAVQEAPREDPSSAGSAAESTAVAGSQPAAGPVRLGSGGSLTLLKKVSPTYPSVMQSARVPGVVVLDAVIHADGTIGDVTVLQSTNDLFARAAIEAVKTWRYTPLPYEGIVTVTVNFTLT
jgi:TonB family protein